MLDTIKSGYDVARAGNANVNVLDSRSVKISIEDVLFNSLFLQTNYRRTEQITLVMESSMASAHLLTKCIRVRLLIPELSVI
jgi:hypothetical protein